VSTLRRSESWEEMRVGVTNPFTVAEDTTAVESTECRSTAEGLTSTASNTLLCACPDPARAAP